MRTTILTYLWLLLLLTPAEPASAQGAEEAPFIPGWGWHDGSGRGSGRGRGGSPYGAYCPKRHADRYGARQPVHTAEDARERLLQLFGPDLVVIQHIEERPRHFRAAITDKNGKLLDIIIIDRRSGRIRSIL